jgi:hypothetical protein
MVDALQEVCQVVVPGGIVVDLRPMSGRYRLEVVTDAVATAVAEIEAYEAQDDDNAADAAVEHAVARGWLLPGGGVQFDFEFYWDTVVEMKAFAETSRRIRRAGLDYAELEEKRRGMSRSAEPAARFRCHRPMMLKHYRKTQSRTPARTL